MKPLDELNAERIELARIVFTPTQIHNWEAQARRDAEAGNYAPPTKDELATAETVYIVAWSRRRYKISKAKRSEPQKSEQQ